MLCRVRALALQASAIPKPIAVTGVLDFPLERKHKPFDANAKTRFRIEHAIEIHIPPKGRTI